MNKPWFEPGKAGNIVLNLPFDDGSWMKIVLGPWIPDFPA
jgi:hypothetical protein